MSQYISNIYKVKPMSKCVSEPIGDHDIHVDVYSIDQREYEQATRLLRHRLKIYFYAAVKYKDHICSFQAIYFIFMMLQILKVTLITIQVMSGLPWSKTNNSN